MPTPTKTKNSAFVAPQIGATPGPGMLHCNACGHDNDPSRSTCENCGENLPGAVAGTANPAIGAAHAPMSRRTKITIFLAVLVFLILVGAGVVIYLQLNSAFADVTNSAETNAVLDPVAYIKVIPGEEIPIACGLTVVVPDDLTETTEQTFHNPQTDCYTTVRWLINP